MAEEGFVPPADGLFDPTRENDSGAMEQPEPPTGAESRNPTAESDNEPTESAALSHRPSLMDSDDDDDDDDPLGAAAAGATRAPLARNLMDSDDEDGEDGGDDEDGAAATLAPLQSAMASLMDSSDDDDSDQDVQGDGGGEREREGTPGNGNDADELADEAAGRGVTLVQVLMEHAARRRGPAESVYVQSMQRQLAPPPEPDDDGDDDGDEAAEPMLGSAAGAVSAAEERDILRAAEEFGLSQDLARALTALSSAPSAKLSDAKSGLPAESDADDSDADDTDAASLRAATAAKTPVDR